MKILLFIVLLFVLVLLTAIIRTLLLPKKKASYKECTDEKRNMEYAEKLSRMVQFETVSVYGKDQADKFREFHKVLEMLFPTVFLKLEKIEIDGNLLMKWKGKNSALEPIILISHQDVVEASGNWTYPPFSGTIIDGKLYGRGSGDIKEGVFAFYQATEELLKEGYVPECDVYLGSSCTEEIGGDGAPKIVNWFIERGIHLYMLCDEGGSIVEAPLAGINGNFAAIGIFEKGYGDLKIIAKGKGGHSSTPGKNTPITRLAAFENEIENHNPFTSKFSPAVENMFENLAPYCENFMLKAVMSNLWLFKPILNKVMSRISPEAAAMLKTTICFTMQSGSQGYNVIPQEAYVTANLRYIPHEGKDASNKLIRKIASKYNLEVEEVNCHNYSKSLDLKSRQFEMTTECISKIFPEVGIMPYVVTGGTDSRFFDPVCDHCVRFTPVNFTKDQLPRMHGIDENISIGVLPPAVDYYKEIIKIQEKR